MDLIDWSSRRRNAANPGVFSDEDNGQTVVLTMMRQSIDAVSTTVACKTLYSFSDL